MNKLKTLKSKTTSPESGLFSKLTKRYTSAVTAKLRKSTSPPSSTFRNRSPQKHIISGSYDMNGQHSDDHRIEIGAPILISKTNFDIDNIDNYGSPLTTTIITTANQRVSSTATSSNESENEIFADAISSFPPNVQDIKFEFLSAKDKESSPESNYTSEISKTTSINSRYSDNLKLKQQQNSCETTNMEATAKNNKNRSKSVQNLHKSEIRLILEKSPSNLDFTTADLENCFDLPIRRDSITTTNSNNTSTSYNNDEFVSPPSSPINSNSISPITTTTNSSSPTKCNSSIFNCSDNVNDSPTISSKSIILIRPPFINTITSQNQSQVSGLIKNNSTTYNSVGISAEQYFNNADSYYKSPTELKPISNINISPYAIKQQSIKSKSPQPPPPLPPVDIDIDDDNDVIIRNNDNKNVEDDDDDDGADIIINNVNCSYSSEISLSSSQPNIINKKFSNSEPNTPMNQEKTDFTIYHYKSVESLQNKSKKESKYKKLNCNNSNSVTNINSNNKQNGGLSYNNNSNQNLNYDFSESLDDFDLKSVSLQSLNAKNLFLSIEELNEITKEINESEEFNNEIDLEYCEHRDNLKPNERRITLLKNKNARLINLHRNKEKLNNAWTGLKQWIGEEKGKFKEVVQKHAALQRVGATTTPKDSRLSTLQQQSQHSQNNSSRSTSIDKNYTVGQSSYASSMMSINATESSTIPTLVGEDLTDVIGDDSESVFTISGGGGGGNDSSGIGIEKQSINTLASKKLFKNKETWEGQNGFEELRRYIKQGGDFGKDLVNILQERIDAEQIYSKSLSKMANKLNKACRDVPGTIVDAWRGVATEMESRSEVHRQLSSSLNDDIAKPLKSLLEAHHKTRKTVETNVDKASRILSEWRISEAKSKKISHTAARENEKLQDAMLDVRIQKSPSIALLQQQNSKDKNISEKEIKSAEKDCAKLDNKRRKAEEAVKRADVEYYTLCIRSERARVDWEMSVLRGSTVLQNLEMQRLSSMKQFICNYTKLTSDINPILEQLCQRIAPQIEACNVQKDLTVIKNIRRAAEGPSEQLLPDFYCEHTTLAMNRERRKHALIKLLQLVKTDLDRERRSRNGLKGLSQTMINQDNQNITDKLYHIRSMLTYLEGSRFKLQSALLELDHKPRSTHPLAPHIQITRDRTGLQQSILKVPLWLKNDDKMSSSEEEANNILNDSNNSSNISGRDTESSLNGIDINNSITDIKNDIIVKNFNRSKSTTDILLNGTHLTDLNIKSNTIIGNNNNQNHHHQHDTSTCNNLLDSPNFDRGIADGGSNQPDSDFDEFSSQDDDDDERRRSVDKLNDIDVVGSINNGYNDTITSTNLNKNYTNSNNIINNSSNKTTKTIVLSKCKALYSYTPKLYDELELTPGDIIEVHVKQDDGWWLGALGDQIGIFPATYVEEFV